MKKVSQQDLQDFVDVVRISLEQRLSAVSLQLQDIGLRYGAVVENEQTYFVVGVVERPITGQLKGFKVQIGGKIRHTEAEDVETLVKAIHKSVMAGFYESSPKIIQLRATDGV